MITSNYYPVKLEDFLEIMKSGTYPIMYCILDDRIHAEMPIENAVFVTQSFIKSIEKKFGDDFQNNPVSTFIKMYFYVVRK